MLRTLAISLNGNWNKDFMERKTTVILLITGLLLLSQAIVWSAAAQTTISGTVRYAQSGETVAGASVIFQTPDGKTGYGFDVTDANGRFFFKYNIPADSVRIMVTGFNLKKMFRIVPLPTGILDFQVEFEEIILKEVMVRGGAGQASERYPKLYCECLRRQSCGPLHW